MTSRITFACSLLLIAFGIMSCQKDLKDSRISAVISNNLAGGGGDKIKLFAANYPGFTDVYTYNENGLLDEWRLGEVSATYKHEYDDKGRLVRAWSFSDGFLISRIDFFYNQQGERDHEIWYDPFTNMVVDEVFYTFEKNLVKSESAMLQTVILTSIDNNGNVTSWDVYINNIKRFSATYTYTNHLKNPLNAIPGLDYLYQNGAIGIIYRNKWYWTSQTFTVWDGEGNILFEQQQDPTKVEVLAGPQNYVQTANFWDIDQQSYSTFSFSYADCGQCSTTITKNNNSRLEQFMRATIKGGKQTMLEKLQALIK